MYGAALSGYGIANSESPWPPGISGGGIFNDLSLTTPECSGLTFSTIANIFAKVPR